METLGPFLAEVLRRSGVTDLDNDPLGIVREYDLAEDRELVALVASTLAYGQVTVMRKAIRGALEPLGERPTETVTFASADELRGLLGHWYYRMTAVDDLVDLFVAVRHVRLRFGSLEDAYLSTAGDHVDRAAAWIALLREHRDRTELTRGLKYLLPDPALGGATKRLHLFFRWVVRHDDGIDLGLWPRVSPSVLLMPLDTHTARICRYLGLTKRNANDLKTTQEIAAALAKIDPADPMKFDFALCHLGISKSCIHRRSELHCPTCPIDQVCTLPWV